MSIFGIFFRTVILYNKKKDIKYITYNILFLILKELFSRFFFPKVFRKSQKWTRIPVHFQKILETFKKKKIFFSNTFVYSKNINKSIIVTTDFLGVPGRHGRSDFQSFMSSLSSSLSSFQGHHVNAIIYKYYIALYYGPKRIE